MRSEATRDPTEKHEMPQGMRPFLEKRLWSVGAYPTWRFKTETQLRGLLAWRGVPGTDEDHAQRVPEREPGTWLRLFPEVSKGGAKRREAKGRGVHVEWRGDGISVLSSENLGRRGDPVTNGGLIPAVP